MNKKQMLYLAGPITGLSYGGTTTWRGEVAKELGDALECLSPMRGKDYLLQETTVPDSYEDKILSSQRAIFCRDMWDCMRCDIVLVNLLGATHVSIGTVMEIAWATSQKKPIILVMEEAGNIHEHAMLREACAFRVTNLDAAITLIKTIANVNGG